MIRKIAAVAVALFFVANLSAAEYKGKLVKVDAEKNTITILVGAKKDVKGEEKTYNIGKDAKFTTLTPAAKKGEAPTEEPLAAGIKAEVFSKIGNKGGPNMTVITSGEGDKESVIAVKVAGKKKKAK